MLGRFEATLDGYLAGVLVSALVKVLKSGGFQETLRIPEPSVIEFQKGSHLLMVQTEDHGPHQRTVAVESETVDVKPLLGAAATAAIVTISEELLGALDWVDRTSIPRGIEGCVADLLG
jgi:predicted RNA binding protein YcfA (HicA-like mRNA interferase family)